MSIESTNEEPFEGDETVVIEPAEISSPTSFALKEGRELNRGFFLESILGSGSLGEAWKARDTIDERDVVIKIIPQEMQKHAIAGKQFREAYKKTELLQHPSLRALHPLTEDDEQGFFAVCDYLDAISVDDYYKTYVNSCGQFSLAAAIRTFWPVARALDYAHSHNLFHRNIKPENILIGRLCGVKLTDLHYAFTAFFLQGCLNESAYQNSSSNGNSFDTNPSKLDLAKEDQRDFASLLHRLFYADNFYEFNDDETSDIVRTEEAHFVGPATKGVRSAFAPTVNNRPALSENEINVQTYRNIVNKAIRRAMADNPEDRFCTCKDFLRAIANVPLEDEMARAREMGFVLDTANMPALVPLVPLSLLSMDDAAYAAPDPKLWQFEDAVNPNDANDKSELPREKIQRNKASKNVAKPSPSLKSMLPSIALGTAAAATLLGGIMFVSQYFSSDSGLPEPLIEPEIVESLSAEIKTVAPEPPITETVAEDEKWDPPTVPQDIFTPEAAFVPPPERIQPESSVEVADVQPKEEQIPPDAAVSAEPLAAVTPETKTEEQPVASPESEKPAEKPTVEQTLYLLAEAGDVVAQRILGEHFLNGTGGFSQDAEQAIFWLRSASMLEDASATYSLGKCYEKGFGVKANPEMAYRLYEAAAEKGDTRAELRAGWALIQGFGTEKNPAAAAAYFIKVAEKGEPQGQVRAGACYEVGFGVSKDIEKAKFWYQKAADFGNSDAIEAMKRL